MQTNSPAELSALTDFFALPRENYLAPTPQISRALLGHFLLRRTPEGICGGEIIETEAYLRDDPACHAYVRQTPRNATMWGEAGHAYVFKIYGAYHCVNPVCQSVGHAEAVLIRALRPRFGLEILRANRPMPRDLDLCSGPSKLCVAMKIDRALDGTDLCDASSELFIARNPDRDAFCAQFGPNVVCTRIGLTRGVELPLRFYLENEPNVSKRAKPSEISTRESEF